MPETKSDSDWLPLDGLANQILTQFDDQGWPDWIDSLVHDGDHPNPNEQMDDVVAWLNRACADVKLRFHRDAPRQRIGCCRH